MKRTFAGLMGFAIVAAAAMMPVDVAHAKKKKHEAASSAAQTTDIDSCGKVAAGDRDSCISRSRPVKGADLYKKYATDKPATAMGAAAEKAKAAVEAAARDAKALGKEALAKGKEVVAAVKGLPAGPTNIDDCAKVDAGLRDQCISRSRPVKGADLYKKYK